MTSRKPAKPAKRSGEGIVSVISEALASLVTVLARFTAGMHLDGRPRSDATFWRRGENGPAHWWGRGEPSRWAMLAGWQRAVTRLVGVAVLMGLWRWRHVTEWALALVGGPVLGLALWGRVLAVRFWRHRRTLERPMAEALSPFLGVPPRTVEAGLAVEPGFEDTAGSEHVAAVELPDHWAATPDQKKTVEQVIHARLGMDLKYAWRTASYPMVLNVTRAPVPPERVPLAEMLGELAELPPHKILLGKTVDGSSHCWDRSREDPHVAVHGGSRRGKTSLLLLMAAQELARGGRVTAIDPKWVSLAPLAGVPGFTLLNDPRDVHAMWAGVAEFHVMIQERFEALSHDRTLEFPNELLMIDEVSMFASITQRAWRAEKAKSDPALAPVWDELFGCVCLGAQVHAHAVVAGQRLDYQVLGGMLGNFGVRLLAGYGPQDYARLVGVPPFLRSQKPRGRFLLYEGGELTWLQLVKADDPDDDYTGLRDFALRGALAHVGGASDLAARVASATGDVIGLAAGAEHLGLSEAAFRKRRERAGAVPGEFRVGNQPAWKPADLDRWAGRREAERVLS